MNVTQVSGGSIKWNLPYPCPVTATCLLVSHNNHWYITDFMRDYHLYANIKPPKAREKTIKILFVRQIISFPHSLSDRTSKIHTHFQTWPLCTCQWPSEGKGGSPGHLHNDVYKSPLPKPRLFNKKLLTPLPWGQRSVLCQVKRCNICYNSICYNYTYKS